MRRTLTAALIAAPLAGGTVMADAIVVYDLDLGGEFAAKERIVEMAKEAFGPTVVYDSGDRLPEGFEDALVPGGMVENRDALEPVPEELRGRLPHTEPNTTWFRAGRHLIELRANGEIVMGVYDVLA